MSDERRCNPVVGIRERSATVCAAPVAAGAKQKTAVDSKALGVIAITLTGAFLETILA